MIPAQAVEWGTDYWGEIFSEPTEGHARGVGRITGAKVYKRVAGEEWVEACSPNRLSRRQARIQQAQPVHTQQRGGEMNITEFLLARIAEDETRAYDVLGERDGDRLLAECAAKRAIIEEHAIDLDMRDPYCDTCAEWWKCEVGEGPPMVKYPCPTIRALTAVYKDHKDYDPEWSPNGG